ncbi:P1 procapsid protein [Pseudomonas phage phi13]|uniref:p1 n=1 Tax=Pseudomonas phage phi13 TaxID=134554 RepID=Q9FZT0_9VIRU|nr:P1 procapsid protein [Pseudomonas phage phi13]AAG00446.1 P1 [Pseudomonas phage phi13]
MLTFPLRKLHTAMPRLTQASLVGCLPGTSILTASATRPSSFNVVHMSSHEGEFFYSLGKGVIDPRLVSRVLMHYSMSSHRVSDFGALVTEFLQFHHAVSTNAIIWRNLVAFVVGQSNDRATSPERMGRMPAEAVRERLFDEIRNQGIASVHLEMFGALEADYAISMLSQIGLIVPGTPLTYRVSRMLPFPDYNAYVDAVRGATLTRVLESLATADLGLVKSQMQKKAAISPSFIANELAAAATRASDRARGSYNPIDVADSVFYLLGTVWDPSTPAELVAPSSIQASDGFSSLLSNLAMFAAYQRRVATNGSFIGSKYDELIMKKEIIPLFIEAVERISPYEARTLPTAVGHIGVRSVSEYDATKSHLAVYESWNFSRSATAFVPIKNSRTGFGRFLMEELSVSDALSSALGPIAETFSVDGFIERHLTALTAAVPGAYDVKADGTQVLLALPSVSAIPTPLGVTTSALMRAMRSAEEFVPDADSLAAVRHAISDSEGMGSDTERAAVRRGEALLHSYYVMLLATAVQSGGMLSVGSITVEANPDGGNNVAIFWEMSTSSKIPLGPTGLLGGRLETSEPLERIAYGPDITPTLTVTPPALPLRDHERSLHVWNWADTSTKVKFEDTFTTTIANKKLAVRLDEVAILSLGYRRESLRFMIPASARAIAEMWVSWYTATDAELTALKKKTKDTAALAALDGRLLSSGVMLVQRLRAIGRSPVGQTMARLINSGLANELRNKGAIDAMKGLYVVPHQIRMEVWSGLVLLQLLGVISTQEAEDITSGIKGSNALATVMTMGLDEK